eukprot:CAMPEP_0184691026 /NCGR_PEP_ID=MMETSP0312-20130426/31587_1 /TAXON_ID=31354 /ORGANISM="Compsopogon coeruleus, Strain SAG 36.94" /LENGTH=340 /DNA_ID=CAMNT_0027148649 /DNA_START=144 /DNA_END=1163 /DNA_ORIENTATION=-
MMDQQERGREGWTRRRWLQVANGILGSVTLGLLVRFSSQLRLVSPKSALSALLGQNVVVAAPLGSDDTAAIRNYIEQAEMADVRVPEFPSSGRWVNSQPLSFQTQLRNKLVLLDFWSTCCINCIHVLPQLAKLEEKFADSHALAVVGVASPKITAERSSENVTEAVARYQIHHPVLNDPELEMWNDLGIAGWPTLVLVSPTGRVISIGVGNEMPEDIERVISVAMDLYRDKLDHRPLPPVKSISSSPFAGNPLLYPGKIALQSDEKMLFIADSGNNRILQVESGSGNCIRVFGGGEPGLRDGQYMTSLFNRPQGVDLDQSAGLLYVADVENHALRVIDTT